MNGIGAYDEVIDFIARGTNPSEVIAFQPSEEVKERVHEREMLIIRGRYP